MRSGLEKSLVLKPSLLLLAALFFTYLKFSIVPPSASQGGAPARQIDFNRDIRPILSDKCFRLSRT